ncbi:MAG: hypothetical protein E6Q46_04730, partial [Flavobacterium sp.]
MQKKQFLFNLLMLLFFQHLAWSQCDINNFTATPQNGICAQDGQVQVSIPGASTCSGVNAVTATIRQSGSSTDSDFQILTSTGMATFSNLASGNYEVRLTQGGVTVGPQNVTVTSTYTPFLVNFSSIVGESCRVTDQNYSGDGSVTGNVNRPTSGTYTYEIQSLGLSSGPTTAQSYTFSNLPSGNYVLTVTENVSGCNVSIGSGFTISPYTGVSLPTTPITSGYGFFEVIQNQSCTGFHIRVAKTTTALLDYFLGNLESQARVLGPNGYLRISYGGNTYNYVTGGQSSGFINASDIYFENVPPSTTVTIEAFDGCNVRTQTYTTPSIIDNYLNFTQRSEYRASLCQSVNFIRIEEPNFLGIFNTFPTNYDITYNFYHEQPLGSGNWVLLDTKTYNTTQRFRYFPNQDGSSPYNLINGENYRIERVNGCNSIYRDFTFNLVPEQNPLQALTLQEVGSVLGGTSAIRLLRGTDFLGFDNVFNTVNFTINRADGMTSYTYNTDTPYSYGDIRDGRTISFPINFSHNFNQGNFRQRLINLPLGEYEITVTDPSCGYSVTKTINLVNPTTYNSILDVQPLSCGAFNVNYDLGRSANLHDYTLSNNTSLLDANGNVVMSNNIASRFSGVFSNVIPGTYKLRYSDTYYIGERIYDISDGSGASNPGNTNNGVIVTPEFTINPLSNLTFSTTSLFCDPAIANSGFIAVQTQGTPVGSITYSLWNSTSNPSVDTPLQTFSTSDLTQTSHIFQNLTAGSYIVRVITDCGFEEQIIKLNNNGIVVFPSLSASSSTVCETNNQTTLSIGLPTSLFDIEWYDGATLLGTGNNSISVNPLVTTTFSVTYKLKAFLGCPNSLQGSDNVLITVNPEITLVNPTEITCLPSNAGYRVTATIEGTTPFTATGSGAPGTWSDNGNGTSTLVSDAITAGTDYNVTISDAGLCDSSTISGVAPICCVFEVICPTFNPITVECYDEIPTATTLTIAEFEALGNANGSIGNNACGIIEITASNSGNTGNCNQTITRTYLVTEYEDTNDNGVRDTGEDTVLHTQSCLQTITVQDATPPMFEETLPLFEVIELECNAVPTAKTLTATDNCGTATVTFLETIYNGLTFSDYEFIPAPCPNYSVITRVWTATDACGLTTTHTQILSFKDTTAPTFVETLPADATVQCDTIPTAVTLTATDNCGTATVSFNETSTEVSESCASYIITRTWTATDLCGNDIVHTQTITVQDTEAPMINCPADLEIFNSALDLSGNYGTATATDNCGSTFISYTDAVIIGDCNNGDTIQRTWYAYDDCGNFSSCIQNIVFKDNTPPAITCPSDVTIECGDSIDPTNTGQASYIADIVPVFTEIDYLADFTANGTGIGEIGDYRIGQSFTATANGQINEITVYVSVSSGTNQTFDLFLAADPSVGVVIPTPLVTGIEVPNTTSLSSVGIPVIVTLPTPIMVTAGELYRIELIANNNGGSQVIWMTTFSDINPNGGRVFDGIQDDPDYNFETTIFGTVADEPVTVTYSDTETITCGNTKTIIRTWTATDACALSSSCVQNITVQDTTDPTFVEALPADATVQCDAVPAAVTLTATDNCGTATVTFNETSTEVAGACANYTITRTWTATD